MRCAIVGGGLLGLTLALRLRAAGDDVTVYEAAPEIGGLASWQAQAILRRLTGLRFLGMDVVEVAPAYDVAEITSLAAATMVYEYVALAAAMRLQQHSV